MFRKIFYLTLSTFVIAGLAGCATKIPKRCDIGGFAVGCQAYSFKNFTAFEAIDKTAEAGGKIIEFFPGQKLSADLPGVVFNHHLSETNIRLLEQHLRDRGIRAVNYGVVGAKSEEEWRQIFEFAKRLKLYGITTEAVDQLDTIEKMVKKYDICVGIHEHAQQKANTNYQVWDPNYVLKVIKNRDARIGACADTGHWQTTGLDALECVKLLRGRIISCHLKDHSEQGPKGHCVPFGTGTGETLAILNELKAQHFRGNISIEYEYHFDSSVPEIRQCVDYIRDWSAKK